MTCTSPQGLMSNRELGIPAAAANSETFGLLLTLALVTEERLVELEGRLPRDPNPTIEIVPALAVLARLGTPTPPGKHEVLRAAGEVVVYAAWTAVNAGALDDADAERRRRGQDALAEHEATVSALQVRVAELDRELAQRTRERDSEMQERWKVSEVKRQQEARAEVAESERDEALTARDNYRRDAGELDKVVSDIAGVLGYSSPGPLASEADILADVQALMAERRDLRAILAEYMAVDGSRGLYHAMRLGAAQERARAALAAGTGQPESAAYMLPSSTRPLRAPTPPPTTPPLVDALPREGRPDDAAETLATVGRALGLVWPALHPTEPQHGVAVAALCAAFPELPVPAPVAAPDVLLAWNVFAAKVTEAARLGAEDMRERTGRHIAGLVAAGRDPWTFAREVDALPVLPEQEVLRG